MKLTMDVEMKAALLELVQLGRDENWELYRGFLTTIVEAALPVVQDLAPILTIGFDSRYDDGVPPMVGSKRVLCKRWKAAYGSVAEVFDNGSIFLAATECTMAVPRKQSQRKEAEHECRTSPLS